MKKQTSILAALALILPSCATTTSGVQPLTLNVTAVEVSGSGESPSHILISASIDGKETIHFPRIIVLEGRSACGFVGGFGPDGEEDGYQIDVQVRGAVATVEARELRDGKILFEEIRTIPVEQARQDS